MASQGVKKWEKYFSEDSVETICRKESSVYDSDGQFLFTIDSGTLLKILPTATYEENKIRGMLLLPGIINGENIRIKMNDLDKPVIISNSKEYLGIRTEYLITLGDDLIITLGNNKILCKRFSNEEHLSDSVIEGMKNNHRLNNHQHMIKAIEDLLRKRMDRVPWVSGTTNHQKNDLGKYFGEVLSQILMLGGKVNNFSKIIIDPSRQTGSLFPIDSTFNGFDSFCEIDSESFIPISSKYGQGAQAQFFSNIYKKAIDMKKYLDGSVIGELVECGEEFDIFTSKDFNNRISKMIIYTYCIRNILRLTRTEVPNIIDVYEVIKQNKTSRSLNIIIEKIIDIKDTLNLPPVIFTLLPESLTSIFLRITANNLGSCKKTIEISKEILSGKNFFQVSLNNNLWINGDIQFNVLDSKMDIDVSFNGSPGSMVDLTAPRGLVTYKLKKVKNSC